MLQASGGQVSQRASSAFLPSGTAHRTTDSSLRARASYSKTTVFVAAFAAASGSAAPAAGTYTPAENPYKGLRAFAETDAAEFYGRDALVDELVRAVGERRLVAVVGPSGMDSVYE